VIDRIVKEPVGGAHRDPAAMVLTLGDALEDELEALSGKSAKQLRRMREDRFLGMGERRTRRARRRAAE
jgi:acetyl-CoA carboxylase carboxyl transferase subunit alpha